MDDNREQVPGWYVSLQGEIIAQIDTTHIRALLGISPVGRHFRPAIEIIATSPCKGQYFVCAGVISVLPGQPALPKE